MSAFARIYAGASGAGGPLLYLPDARGAVLGEWVTLEGPDQPARRGQVIEVGRELTVVQLLEESHGLAPARARITLTGELAGTPVGRELLGRILDGAGRPLDALPAPVGEAWRPVWGAPLNPVRRARPADVIETGISAIDGLNTLVRGQKLPVFSGPGLPALELAARIVESARVPGGDPFAVVFVAIGITERETRAFLDRFRDRDAQERTVVYLNRTSDPTLERLLAPRLALTVAEHLAFEAGLHVLVVMADITHYCEALREIAAYREEIPGRRGYPGYMYTDLATLFERAGILRDGTGSLTQLPVLTMPDDDITHPIPDLTGYITEGQIVLARDLHRRGISPPVDVLPSLSRLMKSGIGRDRTADFHRAWADQIYALYAQGRDARLTAAVVGEAGLSDADRRAVTFADRFESEFLGQGDRRRSFDETFEVGWRLLESVPREELLRIDDETWAARPRAIDAAEGG